MKISIMQPYFLPYIGYFQLMHSTKKMLIHDKIEYSKGGWVNRNRAFDDEIFTIPLKKHSDKTPIEKLEIADNWSEERVKILCKIRLFYNGADNYNFFYPIIEEILFCTHTNLLKFILNSLFTLRNYLIINTKLLVCSEIFIPDYLRGQDMVLAYCQKCKAKTYINAFGGQELYNQETFAKENIELKFIQTSKIRYRRKSNIHNSFHSNLSILDVLMFNHRDEVIEMLDKYTLI